MAGYSLYMYSVTALFFIYCDQLGRHSIGGIFLNLSADRTFYLGILFWFASVLAVLFANQLMYVNSSFSDLMYSVIPSILAKSSLIVLLGMMGVVIFLPFWESLSLF